MNPLLFDASRLIGRRFRRRLPTGIDRVCIEYVRKYGDRALAVVQKGRCSVVLDATASRRLFKLLLDPPVDFRHRLVTLALGTLARGGFENPVCGSVLMNIGHSGLESPHYTRWIKAHGLRPIYMVHDLIPMTHPEFCRANEAERHTARMRTVLATAAGILTNSAFTQQELARFAERSGLALPRTLSAPLAPATLARTGDRPLAEPYFVMLGTIEPRKNHALLLDVWRTLVARHGDRAPRLVVIGQRGWACEEVWDALDRDLVLKPYVLECSSCSDAELAAYLRHAQALLFPSLVEGYGLPLAEALTLGVPALASDLPVFREIAGLIPDYVASTDRNEWLARVEDFGASTSRARGAQLRRLAAFKPPTWDGHFAQVDQLLGQFC